MKSTLETGELRGVLAGMLKRPRAMKRQTLRHLEEYVDSSETSIGEFIEQGAGALEDYQLEILFGPVFTPSHQEQMEVAEALTRSRPARSEVSGLIDELSRSAGTCPVRLPEGGLASLRLHEALVERYVNLLRLDNAPHPVVVESVREALAPHLVPLALTLMRRKGFTSTHQDWFARFLLFISGRRLVENDTLEVLADFLASQRNLSHDALLEHLDALLNATIETGNFAQKGRMYWSSDVAEHHQFRGQGSVNEVLVEKSAREARILETLRADLEAFHDVLG